MAWGKDKRTQQQKDQDDVAARRKSAKQDQAMKRYEKLAQQYANLQGDVERGIMGSNGSGGRSPSSAKAWAAKRDKNFAELKELEEEVKKAYKDAGGTGHPAGGPYDCERVFRKQMDAVERKKANPNWEPWW